MTLFVLLNRSIRYPYYGEIQEALKEGKAPIRTLENLFKNRKVPIEPSKHQHKHATDWFFVHKIWAKCIQFDPTARPTIEDVVKMINQDSAADPAASALNIHLKVSQATYLEQYDKKIADIVARGGKVPYDVPPDNDGSNACAFLSVKIAHEIYQLRKEAYRGNKNLWQSICHTAEKVVEEFPCLVNPYRNSEEYYDVHSAYMLIKSIGPEVGVYDFSEEILANDFIFSRQGMCNLVNALSSMLSNKKFCIAI
ncbi:hypothetical protein ABFA07_002841 [Porites harrisoni]